MKNGDRDGKCYQLAWQYIIQHNKGILIHAQVWSNNLEMMIGHALVETEFGFIYEPVSDRYFERETLYNLFKITEDARYSVLEALVMTLKTGHYGPWDKEK